MVGAAHPADALANQPNSINETPRHITKWNEGTYLLLISASPRLAMSLARSASYRVCAAACLHVSILPNLLGSPNRMISDRGSRE